MVVRLRSVIEVGSIALICSWVIIKWLIKRLIKWLIWIAGAIKIIIGVVIIVIEIGFWVVRIKVRLLFELWLKWLEWRLLTLKFLIRLKELLFILEIWFLMRELSHLTLIILETQLLLHFFCLN